MVTRQGGYDGGGSFIVPNTPGAFGVLGAKAKSGVVTIDLLSVFVGGGLPPVTTLPEARQLLDRSVVGRLMGSTTRLDGATHCRPVRSWPHLASMLSDGGVEVDHTPLFRWVQAYASTLKRQMDETYIRVKGVWTYLYRSVGSQSQTIDFLLSTWRNASSAQRFLCKALRRQHVVKSRTITVDKDAAYPSVVKPMKREGQLWRFSRLRHSKYLNNTVEQDHCRNKSLFWPGLSFGNLRTARRTLAGYEVMAMIRKW